MTLPVKYLKKLGLWYSIVYLECSLFRLKNIKLKLLLLFLLHLFLLKNVLAIELCPNSPLTVHTFDPDIVKNWNSKCFGEIYAPPVLIQRGIFEKGRLDGF